MDTRVWNQVSLEFSEINIQGTIESEGSGNGRDNLSNETIKIRVSRAFDVQVTTADIINSFIINHECTVRMFQSSVGGKNRVVRFDDGGCDLGSWVDGEFQFALFSIINGEPFHEQRSETRSSATTEGVEHQESLKTSAAVSQLPDAIQNQIDDLFPDGVVSTSIVVGSILLARDELLWVIELSVCAAADLICI